MEKVLYFVSNYNAQIIQVGFAIVFILIIAYVYRSFFMSGGIGGDSVDMAHSPVIEQKLNQILEIQKLRVPASGSHAGTAGDSGDAQASHTEEEIDKLKAEIYNLRQQLTDAQKNISASATGSAKEIDSNANASDTAAAAAAASSAEYVQAAEEMVVKVKQLESRLAEYEIIADDIAELSQLRAENAKMKEQLSRTDAPATESKILESIPSEPVEAETIEAAKEVMASPAVTGSLSGQAAIDALFASVTAEIASEPKKKEDQ